MQEAIEQRFSVDPSGQIMKLNNYCPWKSHLYNLEQEMGVEKPILYCLVRVHFVWCLRINVKPILYRLVGAFCGA